MAKPKKPAKKNPAAKKATVKKTAAKKTEAKKTPQQFSELEFNQKIDCTKLPEIALSAEMKEVLRPFLEKSGYEDIQMFNHTTSMTICSSKNAVCIPHQYFLIAATTYEYAAALAPYISFYIDKLTPEDKEKINKKTGKTKTLKPSDLNLSLFSGNALDRELFIDFLNSASRQFTTESGPRGFHDIFKSYYLKTIGFQDASSETLAKIVGSLTQNMDVYEKLRNEFAEDVKAHRSKKNYESFEQLIYYGIPGCGKSHTIKQKLQKVNEKFKIRTVFHPEYSNADFVGQIYPYVKSEKEGGGVDYRFKPGPFARAIRKAYHDPENQYYLCIEEINRGNAAAIFGEMFQLLDRIGLKDNPETSLTGNCYGPGWSAYGINNDDLNDYIREEEEREKLSDGKKIELTDFKWIKGVSRINFGSSTEVRLPSNLSIYATMNTSDQNVFSLDNAFQRRFNLVIIQDKFDILEKYEELENANEKEQLIKLFGLNEKQLLEQYNKVIEGSGVRWGRFRHWINEKIKSLSGISKSEDKRLGAWFITSKESSFPKKDFAEKVFKYLRNDVFKASASSPFGEKPLSEIIYEFEHCSEDDAFKKIFNNDVDLNELKKELKM